MLANADFMRRAIVDAARYRWVASPQPGVERVMLERLAGEHGRATSIVRYAPGAFYPAHGHPGGEEILVLSGVFSEGEQHYPEGWYLRNPPGSSHAPASVGGAIIFVKLARMSPAGQGQVRIDTRQASAWRREHRREICPLFCDAAEQVSLQRLASHEVLFDGAIAAAEVLVISGSLGCEGELHFRGSWLRLPEGEYPGIAAGAHGATVYLRAGK
jgi:anti-sigma factor ChrR (cupin superfamily)